MNDPKTLPLLQVKNLNVAFQQNGAVFHVVKNVSFSIEPGKTLAIVGESGSGKSLTASSILKLLPYPQAVHPNPDNINFDKPTGEDEFNRIVFQNENLLDKSDSYLQTIRGNEISMIFQEPMSALNPLHTIAKQIFESLSLHQKISKKSARTAIIDLLNKVGIKNPENRLNHYPHQLSGGQRQRVMIALAIANKPKLLIADEPTTALDLTTQSRVLDLLLSLQKETGMSILLITHDLSIVPKMADQVAVMKDGELIESGDCHEVMNAPKERYTQDLINAIPDGKPYPYDTNKPFVLSGRELKVYFPIKQGFLRRTVDYVKAVDDISLSIKPGQTIGIVGESGSGKTTLALAMLRLIEAKGDLLINNQKGQRLKLQSLSKNELRQLRASMQFVFQDPYASLNPRMTVGDIVLEGLKTHQPKLSLEDAELALDNALQDVDLDVSMKHRYPHELSGGQRQRVGIARSLILAPDVMVLDEPTSALDRTVQKQIIQLLRHLQNKYQMAYLFISHDLQVVRAMSHDIIVLKNGKLVEKNSAENVFNHPENEYTKSLIHAINMPVNKPGQKSIPSSHSRAQ